MKTLFAIFSLFALPALALGAYNDVSMATGSGHTTNFSWSVGSSTFTFTGDIAAEQVTVNGSSLTANLAGGGYSQVSVTSTDKKVISVTTNSSVSDASYSQTFDCGSSSSNVFITRRSSSTSDPTITVTITPTSETCAPTGGSGGGGGGGSSSGGGGGGGAVTTVVTPQPQQFLASAIFSVLVDPGATSTMRPFTKDLSLGVENEDVRYLQQLLSRDSSIYPEKKITGYYGSLTVKAVRRFQVKYKLPSVGRVGPATRAKLKEVFDVKVVSPGVVAPAGVKATSATVATPTVNAAQLEALQKQIEALQKELASRIKKN